MECADLIASLEPASRQLASSDARCTGSDSRDQRQRQRDRPMKNYWRVAVVGHWCTPNACARSVPYLFRIHLACGCSDASATHKKKLKLKSFWMLCCALGLGAEVIFSLKLKPAPGLCIIVPKQNIAFEKKAQEQNHK
jgi:hypothetical protein